MARDPRVDAYIAERTAAFAQPILTLIREAVHAAAKDIDEDIKWGAPAFCRKGRTLAIMASFKRHAALSFMRDKEIDFAAAGLEAGDDGMGQLGKIASEEALPSARAIGILVKQAIALEEAGRASRAKQPAIKVPPLPKPFADALTDNPDAKAVFEGFPPGARRDYVEWIAGAKRDTTRATRIATAIEWLAEGKKRNWKYENC